MTLSSFTVAYSERVYNALLSLYPDRFRIRFAPEMVQIFRDCCREALEKGEVAVLAAFWIMTMRDLFFSVARERQRELLGPLDADHPFIAIIDLLLIPTMVVGNLMALGPILTLLIRGTADIPTDQFVMTSGFFSIAIGSLTILASIVITKLRPTVRLWVKLS